MALVGMLRVHIMVSFRWIDCLIINLWLLQENVNEILRLLSFRNQGKFTNYNVTILPVPLIFSRLIDNERGFAFLVISKRRKTHSSMTLFRFSTVCWFFASGPHRRVIAIFTDTSNMRDGSWQSSRRNTDGGTNGRPRSTLERDRPIQIT